MDINPANLRWFYVIDILIDSESNEAMINKLRKCQGSIKKAPLAIPDLQHLKLHEHFNKNVLEKIAARMDLEQNCLEVSGKREDIRQPLENISDNRQQSSKSSSVSFSFIFK